MKTMTIFAFLCCFAVQAQDDSTIRFKNVSELQYYERVAIEAGVRIPFGNLADKIGTSPEIGLWFRTRLRNDDMLDIGGTVCIPSGIKEFEYESHGETYKVSPTGVLGMAGVRFCKVYKFGTGTYRKSAEWMSSFGYAYFMYRDRYAMNTPQQNNSHKALSTFHIGQGLRLNVDNVGFQVNYNYTPYGQFNSHVAQNFGAHSLSLGIVYRQ
jgi:hypothetical protein